MALVTQIESSDKRTLTVHQPTRCTYSVLLSPDGKRVFQLDTYGSENRVHPEKVSQSLQLNADSASQLIDLLVQEFPSLRDIWQKR